MRRAAATAAVIGAIAMVGALGLGGVATAQSNKPLTKKQFIKQADKICLAVQQQGDGIYAAVLADNEGGSDADAITALWAEYGPLVQGEIKDLRALREPKADRKKVTKLLAAVQSGLDTITEDPTVLLTGTPFATADRLAQTYGFKVCGASDSNN